MFGCASRPILQHSDLLGNDCSGSNCPFPRCGKEGCFSKVACIYRPEHIVILFMECLCEKNVYAGVEAFEDHTT